MSLRSVVVRVVVDNRVVNSEFMSTWGLSLHTELIYDDGVRKLLFDVSGDYEVWQHNARLLKINPREICAVVISHWHGDHAGALREVLSLIGGEVPVYSPSGLRRWGVSEFNVIECEEGTEVLPDVYTTGTAGYLIAEHGLAIRLAGKEIVLLVGCSHPGLRHLIRRATEVFGGGRMYSVVGGFHITSEAEGVDVAEYLRSVGVKYVVPLHCTGDEARSAIERVFRADCIRTGAGGVIKF